MLTEYYHAARYGAALAEMDWYGVLKLTGSERATWLQGMVTNDVQTLAAGTGCYAAHLTPQGKIVAHMHILADEDALWLSLERAALPKLVQAFNKLLIMEDAQIEDCSEQFDILSVVGPRAVAILESWLDEPAKLEGLYSHRSFVGRAGTGGQGAAGPFTTGRDGNRPWCVGCFEDRSRASHLRRRYRRDDNDARAGRERHQLYEGLLYRAGGGGQGKVHRPREPALRWSDCFRQRYT
jgi:folate-binding Fe-S cluster repair protein YgfZ